MTKIEALNAIEVSDYSCADGVAEYILADLTASNIKILLDAGFTPDQIDDAMGEDKTDIDLSMLGFQCADAAWWSSKGGFVAQAGEGERDEKAF